MKVVVPHANSPYLAAVVECLRQQGYTVDLRDVSGSDEDYWALLRDLWAAREEFCIVEHDNLVPRGTLEEISACPSDWCAVPYGAGVYKGYVGLGCVRFRPGIMARVPDALAQVVGHGVDALHPPKHWCRLDNSLQRIVLMRAGESRCEHSLRPLANLSLDCSHGCLHRFHA